jgi:hypothetical protein
MLDIIAIIYLRLKGLLKSQKWLIYLIAVILIFFIDEAIETITDNLTPDNVPAAFGIAVLLMLVVVGVIWGIYFPLERIAGNRESFHDFVVKRLPSQKWITRRMKRERFKKNINDGQ